LTLEVTMLGIWKQSAGFAALGAVAAWLAVSPVSTAHAQDAIEQDAKSVLAAMSGYLGGLKAFSADYDADFDILATSGQKLKFASSGSLLAQRPGQLRVTRTGTIADIEFYLDGKALTIYGRKLNGYVQLPASTIDEAIATVRDDIGFDAPGADFLSATPFDLDVTDTVSGIHIGMTSISGVSVHHLAFRGDKVDWQLWVQDGDTPLPLKYVVTSKWITGAPEYSLQFSNWNVAPSPDAAAFTFTPPADAKQLTSITVDEIGQISSTWE
jgi:hypothetical protein